ncbi:serine hydrolase domain-containing protein [Paenibacillus terrigena]|uniref:serine hydrolase domain-containing protein n=1 Tax=Paenibacillus terrigena TaxID=369333 RepID=UPI000369E1D2|nr:serine hydrolase domain-containing protein [Paenibacillus terrigena]
MNELDALIDKYDKENYLSGAILIAKDGKILFEKAYGKASIQLDVPNTVDTKFHIASVTKMFIAAAILKLQEQDLVQLHEKPGTYIEEFKALHPNITVHHLLTHSSGLHDIYAVPNLRFEMTKLNIEKGCFLTYLAKQDQLYPPGERWHYSSTGFLILGYIVEKITGLTFDNALNQLILDPLDMLNTGPDNPRTIHDGRAYGHSKENEKYINADNDKLSEVDAPRELFSTVRDLNKWCDALLNGVLSQESIDKMFRPYLSVSFDPTLKYGYGWFLGDHFRLIGGGTPGFRSEIWQFPDEKVNVIMLWNYEKVDSHKLFHTIKDFIV